jgi:hypothetical protein
MLAHELLARQETDPSNEQLSHAVMEAIECLPTLLHGMNINVRFDGCQSMEPLRELTVFDLLRVRLFHGWLVDPEDQPVAGILNSDEKAPLSYNQLTERLVRLHQTSAKQQPDDDDMERGQEVAEAVTLRDFLDRTAQQLTEYGLEQLRAEMPADSFAVLFRNNHYSVLLNRSLLHATDDGVCDQSSSAIHNKHQQLLQLVTDQGFLDQPEIIWETLENIRGDSQFLNWNFEVPGTKNYKEQSQQSAAIPQHSQHSLASAADSVPSSNRSTSSFKCCIS